MMSVIQVFRRLFSFSVAFNIFKVMAFTKSQRLSILNTYFECKKYATIARRFHAEFNIHIDRTTICRMIKNLEKMTILLLVVQHLNDPNWAPMSQKGYKDRNRSHLYCHHGSDLSFCHQSFKGLLEVWWWPYFIVTRMKKILVKFSLSWYHLCLSLFNSCYVVRVNKDAYLNCRPVYNNIRQHIVF